MKINRRDVAPECKCGCGNKVKWNRRKKKWNRYIYTHCKSKLGFHDSNETKNKKSLAAIGKSKSEEHKNNISLALTGRKPSKQAIENRKKNPGKGMTGKKHKEKSLEKMKNSHLQIWEDEDFRKRHAEAMKPVYESLEVRNKMTESQKNIWKDEDYRKEHTGENASNWQGGKSFEIYPQEFNKQLREQIRKRDGYICQLCFISQDELKDNLHRLLPIHHIDYDKKNCSEDNLISLCESCHAKTNHNRKQWQSIFASQ